jgi:hypothetical protein
MGNKIITEEDFWICSEGAVPAKFQGTRESLHDSSGHKYITKSDTSTVSWIDFGCKKWMLIAAIAAAVLVVAAVAIGILTVATGGAGLIILGAIAGLVGGAIGGIVGGLLCGQKMGGARTWESDKKDMILQGTPVITGGCVLTCKAGGKIQYAPNIKSWLGAIGHASLSYSSELLQCAFAGAAAGTVGSLLGVGSVAVAGSGGTVGTGMSLTRAGMQLTKPTVISVLKNVGASFGIGGGWTGAGVALGSRGLFGAAAAENTYALDEVDEQGNPVSAGNSFAKGALPEYEFGSRIADKGLSGLKWTDALMALYLVNIKTDPPGTFRDPDGKLRNNRNNPEGLAPGSFAKDPSKARSGGKGKAYEDGLAALIKERRQTAFEFYKEHNPDLTRRQIRSHLNGIDLTRPVEVVRIPPDGLGPNGNELYQFTKVNSEGKKLGGQYYTDNPNNTPSELGVSDKYTVRDADWNPTDQVNTVKQEKIIFDQSKQVKALKSTSAPINDTWSIEGQSVPTTGTGSQIYVPKNQ